VCVCVCVGSAKPGVPLMTGCFGFIRVIRHVSEWSDMLYDNFFDFQNFRASSELFAMSPALLARISTRAQLRACRFCQEDSWCRGLMASSTMPTGRRHCPYELYEREQFRTHVDATTQSHQRVLEGDLATACCQR